MYQLKPLRSSLTASDRRGERPTAATLAYLLHQARPESFADATEATGQEPLSLVAAEAACVLLAGLSSGLEFVTALELLIEEEREEWAVRGAAHSSSPLIYRVSGAGGGL